MAERKIKSTLTIKKLLERFPKGFAITPSRQVFEITFATPDPSKLPMTTTPGGGFLVAGNPKFADGDEKLFEKENVSKGTKEIKS